MNPTAAAVIARISSSRRFRSVSSAGRRDAISDPGRSLLAIRVPEAIADPAHREQVLGLLGIALELLAKVPDVDVDRARIPVGGVAPDVLQQALAAEHPPGGAREHRQDLELDVGEADRLPAKLGGAPVEVDLEFAG